MSGRSALLVRGEGRTDRPPPGRWNLKRCEHDSRGALPRGSSWHNERMGPVQITALFKRTWKLTWLYRATWLFGALLALTTGNGLFASSVWRGREVASHNTLRLTPALTLNFPGEGVSIDLTRPEA